MQIHKLDNTSTITFQAKLSEKKIIEGVTHILEARQDIPIVTTDVAYFQDMLKGASINPFRKAEIDEWIRDREKQYATFDAKEEERKTREYLEFQERKGCNKIEQILYKVEKFISGNKIPSHPLMKQVYENESNARLFKMFTDLFNSYLELTPKGEKKVLSIKSAIKDNSTFDLEEDIVLKTKVSIPIKPIKPIKKPTRNSSTNNPRQLLNITDEDAQTLLSEYRASLAKYRSYKPFVERTKEEDKIASEYYVNVYLPLLDKIKTHNISVIEKKNFSLNPLEQVKEKHEYIHYEVLPCADFNEASFFDALEMFEKYGKREEFQRTGVSTLAELESSLPKNPTEASVTKLIKLYGKHADDFVYPDERDGAPNCITYEQNFLKVARKATTLKQARLVLENGRRMFWSDRNINKVADAWMVKDGAPLKGNEEVKKILDQMFACAAKNREPFMHDKNLVHEMQYWNVDKRYKF